MELKNFISNCRNPRYVTNIRGERLFVPCGHCADCANRKATRYTAMTINASQEFRYTYFITLKYDEINVPRMYLHEYEDENGTPSIKCIDVTRRLQKNGKYKHLKTYGKVLHTFEKDDEFDEFYKRADIDSKLVSKAPFKNLRWCCKEDLQNFFKRFRFHLSKVCPAEVSYFGVSEYGPQTFRPHFHILLYFNDWRVWQFLRECIYKSWQFGSIDTQCPETNEGICSYVASYLNSTTHLPRYLNARDIKPRAFHSRFLGTSAYKDIRDFVYNADGFPFEKVAINTTFGTRDVIFTQDVVCALFPKCYSFSTQNASGLFELYTIYNKLREKFGRYNPSQLANFCYKINHTDDDIHKFLTLLGLGNVDFFELDLKYNFVPKEFVDDEEDERPSIYSRIYTSILTSRHFLDFVCDNYYDYEVKKKISLICDFYKQRESFLLKEQYRVQEEFAKVHPPHLPNLPLSIQVLLSWVDYDFFVSYERNQLHHYMVFYPLHLDGRLDYVKEILKPHPVIKEINKEKDLRYSEKIKHKELNDKNGIFL